MTTANTERPFDLSQRAARAIHYGAVKQISVPLLPQPPTEEVMAEHHTSYSIGPAVAKRVHAFSMNDYDRLPKEPGVFDVSGSVGVVRDLCGQVEWTCPLGVPGDRLWGREIWNREGGVLSYLEDGDWIANYIIEDPVSYGARRARGLEPKWNKPETMRREDSRVDLLIRDIRVERLRSASIDDIRRCGTAAPYDEALRFQFLVDWSIDNPGILHGLCQNPWVYVIAVDRLETMDLLVRPL